MNSMELSDSIQHHIHTFMMDIIRTYQFSFRTKLTNHLHFRNYNTFDTDCYELDCVVGIWTLRIKTHRSTYGIYRIFLFRKGINFAITSRSLTFKLLYYTLKVLKDNQDDKSYVY